MDHSPSKRGSQGLINCLRFLVWLWGRKFGWEWRRKAQIFEVDGIFSLWVRKKLLNIHLAEPRSMVPQKFANYLHELPSLPFFSSKHPSSSFNRVCAIWNTTGVQWCLLREEERGDQQKNHGQGLMTYVGGGRWVASSTALEMPKFFWLFPQSLKFEGNVIISHIPKEPFPRFLHEQERDRWRTSNE